ncbi:MAG TPA: hypothetical protein VGJ86_20630 [Acidimicrobiales bacterium]|jgi:uncharacterized protein
MAGLSVASERALAERVESEIYSRGDVAHGLEHASAVARLARWLLQGTGTAGADERIVVAAAWCHDLRSRAEAGFADATSASAAEALWMLGELGFTDEERQSVAHCITTASWEHHVAGGVPATIDAEILRDADWLDAMGAHGLARVFAFAGTYGVPLRWVEGDPTHPTRLPTDSQRADPSPFHHFYSKLLWLRDGLRTPRARREGERRHGVLVQYLQDFQSEINRTTPIGS